MKLRPGLVRGAVLTIAWGTLFMVCLYAFFPVGRINTLIDRSLATQGLTLTPTVRKTILPGLAWDNALLSSEQGPLIRLEHLAVRPLLLQLLTGRVVLDAPAIMGRGHLNIEYVATGSPSVRLTADSLELAELPLFKTVLGARVGGALKGEGHAESGPKGWSGELKLEISRLEFTGIRMGAFALPDAAGLRSRGMVRITDGKARLESFTLEGEGLYMRLSGEVPAGLNAVTAPLNLVLEIMPKPEFLEKQKLVFMLLSKFMASPGVYRVPITGTLLKPQIL